MRQGSAQAFWFNHLVQSFSSSDTASRENVHWHEGARGAGNASNPVILAYCKAKTECIARRSQQKLTRLQWRCDTRAEMVRRHQFDGGAAHHAHAVEFATID